ncbi:MAG: anthranilate phosphoribosyltransferase, partial [Deferribacterota bacterium]|nr:anthranilate phosphoribosyltransferase [Deferribacterota bacterium]
MKEIDNKKNCLNIYNFLELLINNELDEAFIKDYLISMYKRGITAEELYETVIFLRRHSKKVDHGTNFALDTCGTGGDGKKTINISSAVSIVLSTLGYPVLKHGNHSRSGLLGSADIFKEIGIKIDLEGDSAKKYFNKHNFLFLYAPKYQLAMHKVKEIRKRLNHPTIFNYVGPLINPGNPNFQIIGVPNTVSLKMYTETASKFKEN